MSRREDIQRLILSYQRLLQQLKEQQATLRVEMPVLLQTETDNTIATIAALQAELRALDKKEDELKETLTVPGRGSQIGGFNVTQVHDSNISIGNIDASVRAGGDVVAGNKETHYHYHNLQPEPIAEKPRQPFEPETILIPAGSFIMGLSDTAGGQSCEGPPHRVTLPVYRIGKYPVTNRQYAQFVYKTGRLVAPEAGWSGQHPPANKLNHPVMGITWFEAMAYCRWLSEQTGRRYTLPTEAQWEKATRGSIDARRYPWGDDWQTGRCRYDEAEPASVDAYPPQSEYGCYDLVGNVREWTRSLWGESRQRLDSKYFYPWREDDQNEDEANANIYRVYRGGAALDEISQLTCSARNGYLPDKPGPRHKRHGFRVVQEL